jgi:hypothetical protein
MGLSDIAKLLYYLTKKDHPFDWSFEEQKAFEALKRAITTAPVLALPAEGRPTRVEVDASDYATGAVLSQRQVDGLWKPVYFISRSMNDAERNYKIHDKEMLAIMRALKEWRPWLIATEQPIEIWTDHQNLQYFLMAHQLN